MIEAEITPFQKRGYTADDEFVYTGEAYKGLKGTVKLKLAEDDGSKYPFFQKVDKSLFTEVETLSNYDKISLNLRDLVKVDQTGIKFDGDKPEFSLLPTGTLNSVLKVLGIGKKKYAKDNWQRVDNSRERYFNAAMRHLTAWWEGEKRDPETGENHLAHATCCLLFLLWFDNKEDQV